MTLLKMTKFVLDRVENIVGKRENTGYQQHFLLFPQCFQKPSLSRFLKVVIAESKESTHPLVFTSTKCAKMSDFSDFIFLYSRDGFRPISRNGHTKYQAGIKILMICNPD